MNMYVSLRGVASRTRPMRDLSKDEREQILRDYLTIGTKPTAAKWNITPRTIYHLNFHNSVLVEKFEDEQFAKAGL